MYHYEISMRGDNKPAWKNDIVKTFQQSLESLESKLWASSNCKLVNKVV